MLVSESSEGPLTAVAVLRDAGQELGQDDPPPPSVGWGEPPIEHSLNLSCSNRWWGNGGVTHRTVRIFSFREKVLMLQRLVVGQSQVAEPEDDAERGERAASPGYIKKQLKNLEQNEITEKAEELEPDSQSTEAPDEEINTSDDDNAWITDADEAADDSLEMTNAVGDKEDEDTQADRPDAEAGIVTKTKTMAVRKRSMRAKIPTVRTQTTLWM